MGDYAAEIEKGVGEEIYAPIFKSGLVLFGSGLISAFMAVIIIVKSNSWEELGLEFERGKEGQLIKLEERPVDVTVMEKLQKDLSYEEINLTNEIKSKKNIREKVNDGVSEYDL
eukprot:CAMPEP_0119037266 /NCGR_PEP_ID=MMETSP1177-20130426/5530_1 /TAXON_ID=2985 /ORGANISM="Ochromonas sp, Strain CCMP1899" /LENGTH=113 /DNA_ID=CAMNT_0006998309 /DNA_START=259 /DNA_END=600 /DNA_ORIENTATION=-